MPIGNAGIGTAYLSLIPGIGSTGISREFAIQLTSAATTVSGTTVTVTATSSGDLSAAVFGVEYSVQDNGGSLTGYTFSKNIVGEVANQSITVTAADGVTSDSTVTVRAYYNLDVLDDPSTRVYANDIVPYVVAGIAPTGTTTEGETLTAVQGVIAGSSPITVTRAWKACDGAGANCAALGSSAATYVLTSSEVGDTIRVNHTGANSAGSDNEDSAATAVVAAGTVTVTLTQAWVQGTALGTNSSTAGTLGVAPTAGSIVVCAAACNTTQDFSGTPISDNFSDTGGTAWGSAIATYTTAAGHKMRLYARVVGTGATGKVVTANYTGSVRNHIGVGEYTPSSAIAGVAIDGVQADATATSTNPSPGNNTTSSANCVLNVGLLQGSNAPTAGSGYTTRVSQTTGFAFYCETKENVGAGTQTANWTAASALWSAVGVGIKTT